MLSHKSLQHPIRTRSLTSILQLPMNSSSPLTLDSPLPLCLLLSFPLLFLFFHILTRIYSNTLKYVRSTQGISMQLRASSSFPQKVGGLQEHGSHSGTERGMTERRAKMYPHRSEESDRQAAHAYLSGVEICAHDDPLKPQVSVRFLLLQSLHCRRLSENVAGKVQLTHFSELQDHLQGGGGQNDKGMR